MVGTADSVLIREVSFIERFHCTPTAAHLHRAGQESDQVLRLVDKDVDEVLGPRSLGRLTRGWGILSPVTEAEGGDDLRGVLGLSCH